MTEIHPHIFIGTDQECINTNSPDWATIHACKNPCHASAVGYRGSLPSTHPNYLILENSEHLYLNMVDMNNELMPKFTNPIMKSAFAFIDKHIAERKLLIHCNQGLSRSPSIALLYLARKGEVANDLYSSAKNDFLKRYPIFNPGRGIELYMINNWQDINHM